MSEEPTCLNCEGTGWVCEDHPDNAWPGLTGNPRCCGGAGSPCGACNLEMAASGYVSAERAAIVGYLRSEAEMRDRLAEEHPNRLGQAYNRNRAVALHMAADAIESSAHLTPQEKKL